MRINQFAGSSVDPDRALEIAQNARQRVLDDQAFRDRLDDFTPNDERITIPFSREDFDRWRGEAA